MDKYKVRLIAKRFTQKSIIDYFDIYSLVAEIITIRVLITLASIHKLIIHQIDVKPAFLNGDIDEKNLYGPTRGLYYIWTREQSVLAN